MRSNSTIRKQFGLSQREMAIMLHVHVSQWSMYECGQRNLPPHATLLLAELLTHLNAPNTNAKKQILADTEQKERAQHLQAMLRENEYQRLLLEKKIAALEKKQAARIQSALVVEYLAQRQAGKGMPALQRALQKANTNDKNTVKTALQYEIKRELLTLEKILLESKLQKINPDAPGFNKPFRPIDEKA